LESWQRSWRRCTCGRRTIL